jgi:DNA repair protein RadD
MIEPRDYQIEGNNALFEYFRTKSGNPVVALPTGTGKSVSISMFLMSAFYQYSQQKMLVLTHVQELIEQNAKELLGMWTRAPVGINSSGLKQRDYKNNIIFGGIASVHKDWEKSVTFYPQTMKQCTGNLLLI